MPPTRRITGRPVPTRRSEPGTTRGYRSRADLDGLPDHLVDPDADLLNGLDVEAGRAELPVPDLEDDDPTQEVRRPVASGATHLPLGPRRVALSHPPGVDRDVRDTGEDPTPVPEHLLSTYEVAARMGRHLQAVVSGEARADGL